MVTGRLPEEGKLRLGSVTLPAGRLIISRYGAGEPVAWATVDPVPEPGRVWDALSDAHRQTGLVPILLDGLEGDTRRPWDDGEFDDPVDTSRLDTLDGGAVLEEMSAGMGGPSIGWLVRRARMRPGCWLSTRRRICRKSACRCSRTRWRGVRPARSAWRT